MERVVLGTLASGEDVYDRWNSHLHDSATGVLSEALRKTSSDERIFFIEEVDMGCKIGLSVCVPTNESSDIVYAVRVGRDGHSRMVRNQNPLPCDSIVVILKWIEDEGFYILITAFIGKVTEPEPWDRNATERSREFWNSHALVWGQEPVIEGTETSQCPW